MPDCTHMHGKRRFPIQRASSLIRQEDNVWERKEWCRLVQSPMVGGELGTEPAFPPISSPTSSLSCLSGRYHASPLGRRTPPPNLTPQGQGALLDSDAKGQAQSPLAEMLQTRKPRTALGLDHTGLCPRIRFHTDKMGQKRKKHAILNLWIKGHPPTIP